MDHRYGGAAVNLPLSLVVTSGVSTAISIYALVMMAAKLGRSIHWMKYTLFIQKASMTIGEPFTDKDMQKVFQRHESNSKTL